MFQRKFFTEELDCVEIPKFNEIKLENDLSYCEVWTESS